MRTKSGISGWKLLIVESLLTTTAQQEVRIALGLLAKWKDFRRNQRIKKATKLHKQRHETVISKSIHIYQY